MSIWNSIRRTGQTMQTQLVAKKNDLKSGGFRDASMAICALVAAADGSVDAEERRKVTTLITSNPVLDTFPPADLQRRFDDNVDTLSRDFAVGKVSVMQTVAAVRKKPVEARAVIQIGIIIGGADGNFDDAEKAVVREACHSLDLPPSEFDL